MILHIQARHFNPQNKLIALITQKINKLSLLNKQIQKGEVRLILEDTTEPTNKVCEIKLAAHGNDIFASSRGNSFEEATTKNIDALQQQIKKHFTTTAKKEKRKEKIV